MIAQPVDLSSGDVRADRRLDYALGLKADRDFDGALELLDQTLEIAPDWPTPHFVRGEVLTALNRRDEAVSAFTDYLRLSPADTMGATAHLATLGASPVPDALPEPYVRTLFDQYAPRFDKSLVEKLNYQAPAQLRDALTRLGRLNAPVEATLDLGCGTGLAGEAFRDLTLRLDGVDLSPGMIEQAERKACYDTLATGDLTAHLNAVTRPYDLILAADVLIYIGVLDDVMTQAFRALKPGGLFAFTTQAWDGADFVIGADCRYAHSEAYLRGCAERAGFLVTSCAVEQCREEKGAGVPCHVMILERPAVADDDLTLVANGTLRDRDREPGGRPAH